MTMCECDKFSIRKTSSEIGAVGVAQLVERLLWYYRSAVRIQPSANIYIEHLFIFNCIEKKKIKKKRPEWPIFNDSELVIYVNIEKCYLVKVVRGTDVWVWVPR